MPWCLIVDGPGGRRRIPLTESGRCIVGSGSDCQIQIDQPTLSRQHLAIHVSDATLEIEDIGSRNGSFLDERRLLPGNREMVEARCRLRLGEIELSLTRIEEDDARPHWLTDAAPAKPALAQVGATMASGGGDRFLRQHLAALLQYAATRPGRKPMLLAYAHACARALPLSSLKLSSDDGALLFDWHQTESTAAGAVLELRQDELLWTIGTEQPPTLDRVRHLADIGTALGALAECEVPMASKATALPATSSSLDPQLQRIYRRATRVAGSEIHVLIRGESGTGKELLARHIHALSSRRDAAFVAVNCAAFSEEMLEAELFGVVRGAATGVDARPGLFERADRGTLFLDEIGDMAPAMQARILRVLQEGEVMRVGGRAPVRVNVRVISATHRDIEQMLRDGLFRLDLLHRIADWEVELPALRDRPADILPLAMQFLLRATAARGIEIRGLSRAAANALMSYSWPGNVRELEREMARVAVFLDQDSLVMSEDLRPNIRSARTTPVDATLEQQLAHAERSIIARAMLDAEQQVAQAAERLGVSRSTLYRRLRHFDLLPDGAGPDSAEQT
ncbi:MAG: sigma 54-interacting transcriptional regulator [Xanthomonadales bacterium]|nr:sigma 54-interacting transcriptional regulator [Xanthomonadales bacterium]